MSNNIKPNKIKKEEKVKECENLNFNLLKKLLIKLEKSICEIIKEKGYGTGFFTKIKYKNNEIYCLITNNHVITEKMLNEEEYILIKMNNKIKRIVLNKKKWTNKEIDYTCIEIEKEDDIEIIEIDEDYNNNKEYDKKDIIMACINNKEEIEMPYGKVRYIEESDKFYHNCNTEAGFSGGPIILIKSMKIIGIHCGYEEIVKKNVGIHIKEIIKDINKDKIEGILDIKNNLLFKSDEEIKIEEIEVYINKKKVKIIKEGKEYKYEDKNIKKEKSEFKINFKNKIKNIYFEECINLYMIDLTNFDTSNVTDMSYMFNECNELKEIKGINKFNKLI